MFCLLCDSSSNTSVCSHNYFIIRNILVDKMKNWYQTEFSLKLKIKVPIIVGPMKGATSPEMVAAASEAGGMGIYPLGYGMEREELKEVINTIRMYTSKPFGINIHVFDDSGEDNVTQLETTSKPALSSACRMPLVRELLKPFRKELNICELSNLPENIEANTIPRRVDWKLLSSMVSEFKISFLSFTFGIPPTWFIDDLKRNGTIVCGTATTLAEALTLENFGVDLVIAQGIEAAGERSTFLSDSGHCKSTGLMTLIPTLVENLKIPVLAAGGIMDSRSVLSSLLLGAAGVVMGTAFLLSYESLWKYKETVCGLIRSSTPLSPPPLTIVTRLYTGKPMRVISNALTDALSEKDSLIPNYPLQTSLFSDFHSYFVDNVDHPYAPLPVGSSYPLATSKSTRDIIYTIIEDVGHIISKKHIRG